ncbi:MAG: cation:proton antiporter [Roseinatronobacter sp.]
MLDWFAMALIAVGTGFFIAGSVGLLRFPDIYCRLHALTKADGLGLALVAIGAALLAETGGEVVRIVLIWLFVAVASATGGHLIASHARREQEGSRL